jgi:hypothetical protein
LTISLSSEDEELDVQLVAFEHPVATSELEALDSGEHYVVVELMLKNTSSNVYNDSPDESAVLIGQNDAQIESNVLVNGPHASSGSLTMPPGARRHVFVAFQVLNDTQAKLLQFTLDSGFADHAGQWSA